MPLDLSSVGKTTKVHSLSYDWRTLATYALGVGAKKDELAYLYEGTPGGMKVLPTFAVIPAQAAVFECLTATGGDFSMIVHGGQTVRVHEPIAQEGTLETTATLRAMYDLKKFAQVIVDTKTSTAGRLAYETTWSIIFRGAGNFGGPRPVSEETPSVPKDRAADFRVEETTSPEQALLYRISGDYNPLHADPAFAEKVGFPQGPILHGLCTFGYLGRAVVRHAAQGDPSKVRVLAAQFRRPVWPADTFVIEGFNLGDGKVALTTSVKERNEAVLGGAYAELAP
ncbi:MAG TPA: MaoC/PaaZ C-terminal domain-containing protein [Polyangiaceae bacterium]|jgi:acyl dehydratase|nr:MaoC/PaaZ C-terminal domain-containing protein [Polyangiaceae bacterium]